ncbi:hypothetical protein ACN6A1_35685 [Myxococcus virescens]|uniref:hypothetical protein n=1 Tax=Myxococcus virescens TaxID=83456 RepID=UPI003DA50F40
MFVWKNLDARTRDLMEQEVKSDNAAGTLYLSKYFAPTGATNYLDHLLSAIRDGSEQTLADDLRHPTYFKSHSARGTSIAAVPVTAPDTFAEGQFNRFYIRALCLRAIQDEIEEVIVYRAKEVNVPRPESEALIGRAYPPDRLLKHLRAEPGVESALGLTKPNSGLSVHLP